MPLYFMELDRFPLEIPPVPEPRLSTRIRETVGFGVRAFPRLIGLRQSA